ncbi:MAG: hypothetical protein ACQSGP_30215 [Frankia sp.]
MSSPGSGSPAELQAELAHTRAELARLQAENRQLAQQPAAAQPRRGLPWRRIAVITLLIVGWVLAPISVVGVWAHRELRDTNTYVSTVAPLAKNPAIQAAATTRLTNQILANVDVPAYVKSTLPPRAQPLAGPITDQVEGFIHTAAGRVVASDAFATIWTDANRAAHTQLNKLIFDEGGAVTTSNGQLVVNLHTAAVAVVDRLKAQGLSLADKIPVDKISGQVVIADASSLGKVRSAARLMNTLFILLPIVALASLGAAVGISRRYRRTLIAATTGVAVGMAVLGIGLTIGRSIYLDALPAGVSHDAASAAYDTILHFLRISLRTVFTIVAIIALGAALTGPSRAAVAFRAWLQRLFRHGEGLTWIPQPLAAWTARYRRPLRIGLVALALIVLVLWPGLSPATVITVAIILLVLLAVLELLIHAPHPTPGSAADAPYPAEPDAGSKQRGYAQSPPAG